MEWGNSWGNIWGKAWEEHWKHVTKIDRIDKEKFLRQVCPVLTNELKKYDPQIPAITRQSPVLIWNYMINGPHVMGQKFLPDFIPLFLESITLPKEKTPILGEAVMNARPYKNLVYAGFQPMEGLLADPFVLLGGSLQALSQGFRKIFPKI